MFLEERLAGNHIQTKKSMNLEGISWTLKLNQDLSNLRLKQRRQRRGSYIHITPETAEIQPPEACWHLWAPTMGGSRGRTTRTKFDRPSPVTHLSFVWEQWSHYRWIHLHIQFVTLMRHWGVSNVRKSFRWISFEWSYCIYPVAYSRPPTWNLRNPLHRFAENLFWIQKCCAKLEFVFW